MNRWKVALMLMLLCGTGLALGQSFPTACDVVRLKDGFRLHGQIIGTKGEGTLLVLRTYGGQELDIAFHRVKSIRQRCADEKPYSFRERGWYHHTRLGFLWGQTHEGDLPLSFQFQHSSGWMFHRSFGIGVGTGLDFFEFSDCRPMVIPFFIELRSYLLARSGSPFLALGGGIGVNVLRCKEETFGRLYQPSGRMAQVLLGYRLNNRLILHSGLRWQHSELVESTGWWGTLQRTMWYWRFMTSVGWLF